MKKRNLALAMVLSMAMTTIGSATVFADDASDDAAGNDYTIAYVPTTMNNPFWTAMLGGIKEEMEAKGMDVDSQLVTVDANSDQATMNNYVNDLIAQEVDAIILAPMDCTAVTEALQACEDAGIPVINVDTAVDASDKVVSIIASDNYRAGVECANDMMSKLDEVPRSQLWISHPEQLVYSVSRASLIQLVITSKSYLQQIQKVTQLRQ